MRVAREIEQLWLIFHVVDIFELAVSDRESAGGRAHAVILAQHGAIRSLAAGKACDRNPGMVRVDYSRAILADTIHDERINVEETGRRLDRMTVWNALACDDQRHPRRFLVQRRFSP